MIFMQKKERLMQQNKKLRDKPCIPGNLIPGGTSGKEFACQYRRNKRRKIDP